MKISREAFTKALCRITGILDEEDVIHLPKTEAYVVVWGYYAFGREKEWESKFKMFFANWLTDSPNGFSTADGFYVYNGEFKKFIKVLETMKELGLL